MHFLVLLNCKNPQGYNTWSPKRVHGQGEILEIQGTLLLREHNVVLKWHFSDLGVDLRGSVCMNLYS